MLIVLKPASDAGLTTMLDSRRRMPELDGIRGLAILMVLVFHRWGWAFGEGHDPFGSGHGLLYRAALWLGQFTQYGWSGVDLFFVLSGFLITGILLDSRGAPHALRNFYARRVLRIWPLYFALLGIVFLIVPRFDAEALRMLANSPWPVYVVFAQNFITRDSLTYAPLGVMWSLAIEEQFYIVWPLMALRFARSLMWCGIVGVIVVQPLLRAWFAKQFGWEFANYCTFCRLDAISWGALLALWIRSESCTVRRLAVVGWSAATLGLAAAAYCMRHAALQGTESAWAYSWLAIGFCGLVSGAYAGGLRGDRVAKALAFRPLAYTGTISYGLYLLHVPVYRSIHAIAPQLGSAALVVLLQFLVLFALAAASYRWFEGPMLRLKSRFATSGHDTLVQGAATS
jgi:peptidoglycan/LPS O-acetylase OafA/YrhL